MKRWLMTIALFLLPVVPGLAQGPLESHVPVTEPTVWVQLVPFPAVKETMVSPEPDPHARLRVDVLGEEWSFSLLRRRWGWEVETAYAQTREVRALIFASLDYLRGDPQAFSIFAHPDQEYVLLLTELAGQPAPSGQVSGAGPN